MAATVLLTGATGYVGSRLLRVLEDGGLPVRCLARQPWRVAASRASTTVVAGDCLDDGSLAAAMEGVDQAYYLVHSMASGDEFASLDRQAAANFARAAARAGVRRIVYLGGLGGEAGSLSPHLKSRAETGQVLRQSGVPVVEFRASIIIGAGSLSFEMIRALVERLPAMICPRWVDTRTQPIAIDDVLAYLRSAIDLPLGRDGVFEIGGPDVVSYGDMMREYARIRGLRRLLIPVPLLTPRLSGLWLRLVTPAQARVGRALVEGLRNPTVVRSFSADEMFPAIHPTSLSEAFVRAIDAGASGQLKIDTHVTVVDAAPGDAFAPIRRIGGATGWYFGEALLRLRGWIDHASGGVGMPRFRRHPDECVVGDVIDGWCVEAYEPDRLLRLAAGMRLPGRGWLEFRVTPLDGGERSLISQTATFDPKGIAGRLYWYAVLPLHAIVFRGLLRSIARRASRTVAADVMTVSYCSIVDSPAAEVFRWHEQPDAVTALAPASLVRIERQKGGIRDNDSVTLSIGIGPARLRWAARHYGYIAGRRFCDEQVSGPFAVWRHMHLFEPIGRAQTLYEDRIEFAVTRSRLINGAAAALLRPLLAVAFAQRHRILRRSVGQSPRAARRRWAVAALALTAAAALHAPVVRAQAAPAGVRTVPFVDIDRYLGDWFEIARYPNRFQRTCLGDVRASYARRPDGRLDVVNRCRTAAGSIEARGVARVADARTFSRLEVRFAPAWLSLLPMVWGDYWVIGLADDYSWAVVGSPDREYLWILARTPRLDDQRLATARAAARSNGFALDRILPTDQRDNPRP